MKFLYSTILALAATGAHGQATNNPNPATIGSASDLYAAWQMGNADITYTSGSNMFTLDFTTTSAASAFDPNSHINEEFYDKNCRQSDPAVAEKVIASGIVDPTDNTLRPQASQDSGTGAIKLEFEILPQILTADSDLYTDNGDGTGVLEFCVRTSLGYGGDNTSAGRAKSLKEQETYGYEEVNFIESLITVEYDLSSGFTTVSANVKPKERVGQTDQEDVYGLTAWICDKATMESKDFTVDGTTFTRTYPIVKSYSFFNQGDLIPVCIRPDDTAYTEGVVMRHISKFDWQRTVPVYGTVTQEAIKAAPGVVADNRLTYHATCDGAHYCLFESVLFADFYVTQGVVNGSGTATVKYEGTRRLAAAEDRKLQEDATPFDVAVPLAGDDSGPGALKTAGGVSLGLTALASFIALASAGLMA